MKKPIFPIVIGIFTLSAGTGDDNTGEPIMWIGLILFVIAEIYFFVLLYRVWKFNINVSQTNELVPSIETPGKAVGITAEITAALETEAVCLRGQSVPHDAAGDSPLEVHLGEACLQTGENAQAGIQVEHDLEETILFDHDGFVRVWTEEQAGIQDTISS